MNNVLYCKTMENLRKRVGVKLVNNKKTLFEMDIKTKLHTTKKFDRDMVAIHKIKTTLTPNKPAYLRMCSLKLSKVSIYELHHDYIKNK